LKALYANLRALCPTSVSTGDSLMEFQDADRVIEQLENIIVDAEEVIKVNGVDIDDLQ